MRVNAPCARPGRAGRFSFYRVTDFGYPAPTPTGTRWCISAGKDLETIRSEKPTRALDEEYGRGAFPPDLFIEMVYRSLLRE